MPRSYAIAPLERPCIAPDCDQATCSVESYNGPPGTWCSTRCFHRINKRWIANGSGRRHCSDCGYAIDGAQRAKALCEECKAARTYRKAPRSLTCDTCSAGFESSQPNTKYCGRRCKRRSSNYTSYQRQRHRRITSLTDTYSIHDIAKRDGWNCWLCASEAKPMPSVRYHPRKATIDHVVPISKAGPDIMANVRIACWECNQRRGAADVEYSQLAML